jgi:hypothetical protein
VNVAAVDRDSKTSLLINVDAEIDVDLEEGEVTF